MNESKNIKLLYKPYRIVLLTLVPLVISIGLFYINLHRINRIELENQKKRTYELQEQKIIAELQARIETAWSVVEYFYTEGLGQEACKQVLQKLTFDENNYVWVHMLNKERPDSCIMIVHANKDLINKDLTGLIDLEHIDNLYLHGKILSKDSEEVRYVQPTNIFKAFNESCLRDGDGVVRYYWPKIIDGKAEQTGYLKVSYVKYFPQWNWVLGAGAYADHIDEAVQVQETVVEQNAKKIWRLIVWSLLIIGAGVTVITFFVSNVYSRQLSKHEKKLRDSKIQLADEMEKVISSQEHLLRIKQILQNVNNRLRSSEEQYRSVIENVNIGISLLSPDMKIISANRQMQQWFSHINFDQQPICYHVFNDSPQDDICEYCPVARTFKNGQSHEEVISKSIGKRDFCFRLVTTPIKNEQEQITAVVQIMEDITERTEMENALRSSEKKYRGLHESIMDAIVRVDLNGRIIDCNHSLQAMLGYSRQELEQMTIKDISPKKWHAITAEITESQVFQRGYSDIFEKEFCRKDGRIFPAEFRIFLLKDDADRPIGTWGIVRDITERKAAEAKALRNERIFRTLIANLPQKVLLKDRLSRFVYCNEKYAEAVGLPVDQIVGKTDYDLYPKETAEKYIQSDRQVMESGKPAEHFFRHHEGSEEYITRVLKTTVKNEIDKINGILCVFEDFTERIKTEEGLKNANRELKETNRQLKEMQSQLVQNEKMASIGQLAAGIAHEINNPMGFVTSNFSTLRKYIKSIMTICQSYEAFLTTLQGNEPFDMHDEIRKIITAKDEMQIDYIFEDIPGLFDDSSEGMERIIRIVKNLRDFSRIDQVHDFADFNLTDGIRSTLIVANNELKYATEVVTDFADNFPDVYCNCGQLNQVFLNILVNAAQAIGAQDRNNRGTITIKAYSDDDYVICIISDDGPGISPENISKIFDPFFTTKPIGKGTGLGLNLSYDIIVNKHKGELLVDSDVGKGTQFTIKIPRNLKSLMAQAEVKEDECEENSLICG